MNTADTNTNWRAALNSYEAAKAASAATLAAAMLPAVADPTLANQAYMAADVAEVAAVRRLIATPAPDAAAMALKVALFGRVDDNALDFAGKPATVGLILERPDECGSSAALLSLYFDTLRLSGGEAVVQDAMAVGRAAFAAHGAPTLN